MAKSKKSGNYNLGQSFTDGLGNLYTPDTSKNLIAHIRMKKTGPVDLGPNGLSPVYDNSPQVVETFIGRKFYDAVVCTSSEEQNARVTSSAVSFTSLADGGTPTSTSDSPFSISMFVKIDDLSSAPTLVAKGIDKVGGLAATLEYSIDATSAGKLHFGLYDAANAAAQGSPNRSILTDDGIVTTGKFYHIVATYNGVGGTDADSGLKIYVDGVENGGGSRTESSTGTYVGMKPSHSAPLYFGATKAPGSSGTVMYELDGQIAEVAIFSKALSVEEIHAIANATKFGSHELISGYVSNPPRVLLQDKDNRTGSYPTIRRTGDKDFLGNFATRFDDTNTVIYDSGVKLYPVNLPPASKFISGNIASPNVLQGIAATATSKPGVADAHISFTPGENISPFVDSRIAINNDAEFYTTGTASGTLPGFSQRLSSKTAIVIDTNPKQATDFFFSTGTLPNASGLAEGVNSSLGYFNWTDKRWEIIGDLSSGSNIDILNEISGTRSQGLLACVPSGLINIAGENIEDLEGGARAIINTIGFPQSSFGFPFASRYDATGSQLLDMSSYINAPFLLEKLTLEFSASFGPAVVVPEYFGPQTKTFMLLTQKSVSGAQQPFTQTITKDGLGTLATAKRDVSITHGKAKSILAFGQVSLLGSDDTPEDYKREVNVTTTGNPSAGSAYRNSSTGSFRMEMVPRTPQKNNFGGIHGFWQESDSYYRLELDREILPLVGGRSGFDISDGRSFVAGVGGLTPTGSFTFSSFDEPGTNTDLTVTVSSNDSIARTSPVVILPSDKLLLCFSNTPSIVPYQTQQNPYNSGRRREEALRNANAVLSPGAGKLTLYGSMLQNNLPKDTETNQPLTSDAIHEDLHYDNPIYDQFDVEPLATLTGSYVDNVVTGSMLVQNSSGEFGDSTVPGVREIRFSVAKGEAGDQGSLQRFVRHSEQNATIFDTATPNPGSINAIENFTLYNTDVDGAPATWAGIGAIIIGAPGSALGASLNITWVNSFPFQPKYAALERTIDNKFGGSEVLTNNAGVVTRPTSLGIIETNTSNFQFPVKEDFTPLQASSSFGGFAPPASDGTYLKLFYGFGDRHGLPNVVDRHASGVSLVFYTKFNIRGFKYGLLNATLMTPSMLFRRDRYGQFRDMLEQRPQYAILATGEGDVDFPVTIDFVPRDSTSGGTTDPESTHSQNLSRFATSSLPYFEGRTVDRSDNPDQVLVPIEVL